VQRTVKIVKNLKKRTEVLEKRYVIAHFCFHFWIQRGQIIKIYLFSSRGKTNRLNICFLMLLSSIAVPNFVEFWSLCYLTFLRTQKLYSVERHTKIIINCEQIRTWNEAFVKYFETLIRNVTKDIEWSLKSPLLKQLVGLFQMYLNRWPLG